MRSPAKTEARTSAGAASARLPLSSLLSQVLVAFTIEFDNEAERQMPHRTTRHSSTKQSSPVGSLHAPWLVSLAMWSNCMQFVGEQGIRVGDLESLARTKTNLDGMVRWGYIVVEPDAAHSDAKLRRAKSPNSDWLIRATPAGRKAQEIWRPLFGVIEQRWQERFGKVEIAQLRESLWAVISQLDASLPDRLPDCLPILEYGLFSRGRDQNRQAPAATVAAVSELPLPALLSKVLLAIAIEFERDSEVSLAISANVLRLVGEEAVRVRDLPRLAGVSKEAIAVSLNFLQKRGYAAVKSESSASRVKVLTLTPKGRRAQDAYPQRLRAIEERWQTRLGDDTLRTLRESLERFVGEPTQASPLFRGLEPHPDGWRASVPRPARLPHYPMVLHRGGFPDGS